MTVTQLPNDWPDYAGDFVIPVFVEKAMKDIVDHYDTKVDVPLPERRYWTIGQTAHDFLPVIDMEIMLDLAHYFDPYNIGVVVNVDPIPASGGYHGAIATYSVSL
jgi:hypothetical protein